MRNKLLIAFISIVVIIIIMLGVNYWLYLRKAHSTFENYYTFRGCTQLLEKTDIYGTCKTNSGQVIKIVEYRSKWYLDGDLPWACMGEICFGM
jgi:hypothetical protein